MGKSKRIVSWLKGLSKKHKNLTVIFNRDNIGTARGRNQAIRRARGRYVVFLDNDVRVSKKWLEPLIKAAESNETIGACGAKVLSKNGRVAFCASRFKVRIKNNVVSHIGLEFTDIFKKNSPKVNQIREVPWYPTTCFLVKKEVLDRVGGFDENLAICEEDKDLSLSIRQKGFRILYVPSSCVYHDRGSSFGLYNKIRDNIKMLMHDINYFEKKWNCKVFMDYSRSYLRKIGLTDRKINQIKHFSFFHTIIDN